MRLKRLELFGFKSFADRTSLAFDHSLVGIVGPNGCGKSNVVDAVRWVLGETRPTSMRGGEMTDVIFKGSVSRPSMSLAEVTLILDNAQGELGPRGAEVAITRRVDRSGEGEYLINGEKVRLKDLRDMLYDTGLGSRGYSVLEQGRIDAVLSQNPLDRRAIFEEAAGISRFRQRKKETEARLKRVEVDMTRLDDILRELATRVRSLKIQAGKAERFVQARDEWRAERGRFLRHRIHQLDRELTSVRGAIGELEARCNALRQQREGQESDAKEREREQRQLAAEVDRLSAEVARLLGESRALDERASQLSERVGAWRAAAEDESARAMQLAEGLEVREAEIERLSEQRHAGQQRLTAIQQRHDELDRSAAEVRASFKEIRAEHERENGALLGILHERTAAQNTLAHLEQSRSPLHERRERALVRVSEAKAAADELRGVETDARARLQQVELEIAGAEAERAALAGRIADHERSASELAAEKTRVELERARAQSRIDALLDWDREREALEAGARALFDGVDRGDAPCTRDELAGVLADHLRASTRHARALDAALGERALSLVASDPDTASRLLRWLSEKRAGAVRLVVPGALARRSRALPSWSESEQALVQGRLLDVVETQASHAALADALIGDVWIVRDHEAARTLVTDHPDLRFVTLEGDLIDAAGLFGGHREIAQGAVGRRSTAHELESVRESLVRQIDELSERLAQAAQERQALAAESSRAQARVVALRESLGQAKSEGHAARTRLADVAETLAVHEREAQALALEAQRLEDDVARATQRLAASEEGYRTAQARVDELEAMRASLEARRDELVRELSAAEVELARARAELEALAARATDLERTLAGAKVELERARRLSREHADNAQAGVAEATRLTEQSALIQAARADVERELAERRGTERAGRDAIEAFRRTVDAVTRELEELSGALSARRLDEQRLDLERAELAVRSQEDLGLDEFHLLDGFAPDEALLVAGALVEIEARVAELKLALDKLGPVNTESVQELAEAEGRFQFLDGERKDLQRSRQTLEAAVAEINQESERLFVETFDEVRTHFQHLFRQLFGGGKADLVLIETQPGQGPLEAGIEITARPPGREMLPIGLLSGGQRTMTALALLFAVFKARPSPFCVLDEVDAALDDANVGRFLAMLDDFRRHTQFIVVTHNKGTMAACASLYGITMEVKGVSRHVAVQFGDVDRIDPHATGDAGAASASREEIRARQPVDEPEADPSASSSSGEADAPPSASLDGASRVDLADVVLEPAKPKRRAAKARAASVEQASGDAGDTDAVLVEPAPAAEPAVSEGGDLVSAPASTG